MRPSPFTTNGFTLVELSVVLVIIGILAGGILAGSNLISTSRDLKAVEEIASYEQAVMRFWEKYGAIPGDMPRADTYWGAACGNAACNGDGDRVIDWGNNEGFKAWQHLGLSGMIKKGYTGTSGDATLDSNIPRSDYVDAVGFYLYGSGVDNYLGLMGAVASAHEPADGNTPALLTELALRLDSKLDDGLPSAGKVRGFGINCIDAGAYKIANTARSCELQYQLNILQRH